MVLAGAAVVAAVWTAAANPQDSPVVLLGTPAPPLPTLEAEAVARGAGLYAEYCAGCHGVRLEGASNWKSPLPDGSYPPPPHDASGHTWHHPDGQLRDIVLRGGGPVYGGTMPAFGDRLSGDQVEAILTYIKDRWGRQEREYQWWITFHNP